MIVIVIVMIVRDKRSKCTSANEVKGYGWRYAS